MNLLKADLFHLIKDKLFYVMLGITFILPVLTCLMPVLFGGNASTTQSVIFQGLGTDIICVLIGIEIASFIGKDYYSNTIRNKICYGESRYKVVLAYFVEATIITLSFVVVSFVSSLLFGSICGTFAFTADFAPKLFCQILILLAFTSIITAIVVSTKSMKAGLIFTVLISVLLGAVSYLFPMLAATNTFANILCRVLYMITSTMLISGTNGVYVAGEMTFEGLYQNAILIFIVYAIISIGVSLLVTKKHNYK